MNEDDEDTIIYSIEVARSPIIELLNSMQKMTLMTREILSEKSKANSSITVKDLKRLEVKP